MGAYLDHVAVAVPSIDAALPRWHERLGGVLLPPYRRPDFVARQLRYPGGGKVELLAPATPGAGFVADFLARRGSAVHHLTVVVDDLDAALAALRRAGIEPVDEDRDDEWWHEAFVRPSLAGGVVVQVAWTPESDEQWAHREGATIAPSPHAAAVVRGALLGHPEPRHLASLWTALGARVELQDDRLRAAWDAGALDLVVERTTRAAPLAVRAASGADLPDDEVLGAAVRTTP